MNITRRPSMGQISESSRSKTSCRLVNWRLKNFKSVVEQEIDLSPLTVLVGANSSGKSSLIQSILFMAQNAQPPLTRDAARSSAYGYLQLNGDLVQLGTYNEVLNDSVVGNIGLGGKIEFVNKNNDSQYESRNREEIGGEDRNVEEGKRSFDWSITLREQESVNPQTGEVKKIDSLSGVVESYEAEAIISSQDENQIIKSYSNTTLPGEEYLYYPGHGDYNNKKRAEVKSISEPWQDIRNQNNKDRVFEAVHFMFGIPTTGLSASSIFDVFIHEQGQAFTDQRMKSRIFESLKMLLSEHFNPRVVLTIAEEVSPRLELSFRPYSGLRRPYICSQGHNFYSPKFKPRCPQCSEIVDSGKAPFPKILSVEQAKQKYISKALDFLKSDDVSRMRNRLRFESLLVDPLEIGFLLGPDSTVPELFDSSMKIKETFTYQKVGEVLKRGEVNVDVKVFELIFNGVFQAVQDFWREVKEELFNQTKNETFTRILQSPGDENSTNRGFIRRDSYVDHLQIGTGAAQLQDLLQRVVYLGPLRAAPVDLFARFQGARSAQMPLGQDGGYLAQKIYENEWAPDSDFPLPPCSSNLDHPFVDFNIALKDWMRCLGIGNEIESKLQGHYGYLLTIDGKSLRVMGTGVSQVLPVIALCLLAPKNGVILLEEPELHLHPRIQQKLANFFLAVSESGRQVIVETHSEYLITRLRLLAAQNVEKSKLFSVVFTSKVSGRNGEETIFTPMNADSTGELPPWPAGFFDQVTDDIKDLIVSLASKNLDQT
jgi:predicted ATPase